MYNGSLAGAKPNGAVILSDRSGNDTVNWNINGWHIENFSVDQVMSQLGGQEGEDLVDTIGLPDGLGWVSVENLGCNFPPHNASSTESRSGSEQHKIYDYSQCIWNDITSTEAGDGQGIGVFPIPIATPSDYVSQNSN